MTVAPEAATIVGLVAAACTTIAFVPQVIRVYRLRNADAISLATFALFSAGTAVWLVYGLLIGSIPVIVANALTLGLALAILGLKVYWDRVRATPTV